MPFCGCIVLNPLYRMRVYRYACFLARVVYMTILSLYVVLCGINLLDSHSPYFTFCTTLIFDSNLRGLLWVEAFADTQAKFSHHTPVK